MKSSTHPVIFVFPNRYCCTIPVSTNGSLWTGYGGWHYVACSFSVNKLSTLHKFHFTPSVCQLIPPDVDHINRSLPSRQLHTRLRPWQRIDETFAILGRKHSHNQAA